MAVKNQVQLITYPDSLGGNLKTLNQVEVIMHTEYFARNLSSAACKLSPEFEEKYTEDCSYKKEVTDLCAEMRRIYRIEKGLEER